MVHNQVESRVIPSCNCRMFCSGSFLCGENMSVPDDVDQNARPQISCVVQPSLEVQQKERNLCTVLNNLQLDRRDQLFVALKSMRNSSHIYHIQWKELDPNDCFIEKSYDMVRRYEANGLQLDGFGCWLFEKVLVGAKHRISSCTRYPPSDILELILRIMLEHKAYLTCRNILTEVVSDLPPLFGLFCSIGMYMT